MDRFCVKCKFRVSVVVMFRFKVRIVLLVSLLGFGLVLRLVFNLVKIRVRVKFMASVGQRVRFGIRVWFRFMVFVMVSLKLE